MACHALRQRHPQADSNPTDRGHAVKNTIDCNGRIKGSIDDTLFGLVRLERSR